MLQQYNEHNVCKEFINIYVCTSLLVVFCVLFYESLRMNYNAIPCPLGSTWNDITVDTVLAQIFNKFWTNQNTVYNVHFVILMVNTRNASDWQTTVPRFVWLLKFCSWNDRSFMSWEIAQHRWDSDQRSLSYMPSTQTAYPREWYTFQLTNWNIGHNKSICVVWTNSKLSRILDWWLDINYR